jgi:hypothetical protein
MGDAIRRVINARLARAHAGLEVTVTPLSELSRWEEDAWAAKSVAWEKVPVPGRAPAGGRYFSESDPGLGFGNGINSPAALRSRRSQVSHSPT